MPLTSRDPSGRTWPEKRSQADTILLLNFFHVANVDERFSKAQVIFDRNKLALLSV